MKSRKNRDKAIAIARDVLLQLRKAKIIPSQGVYCRLSDENVPDIGSNGYCRFLDQNFKKVQPTCEACAKGSLLIAYVNKFNKLTIGQVEGTDSWGIEETLKGIFSELELHIIEGVFELTMVFSPSEICENVFDELNDKVRQYGERYDTPNARLRAIMLNIIRNDGEFKLPKRIRKTASSLTG